MSREGSSCDWHRRATALFLRVRELPVAQRQRFLERACDDPRLRREVATLLEHDATETLLEGPVRQEDRANPVRPAGRAGLLATALVVLAVVAPIAAAWNYREVTHRVEARLVRELESTLNNRRAAVREVVEGWRVEALAWARRPEVQSAAEALLSAHAGGLAPSELYASEARAELFRLVEPYLSAEGNPWVTLVSADGVIVADPGPEAMVGARLSRFGAAVVSDALAGSTAFVRPFAAGEPRRESIGDERAESSAGTLVAIANSRGDPGGVLVFGKRAAPLTASLDLAPERRGRDVYLISQDGFMLTEPAHITVLVEAGLVPAEGTGAARRYRVRDPGVDLSRGGGVPGSNDEQGLTVIARRATVDRPIDVSEAAVLSPYRNYAGIEVVGGWAWIQDLDLGLIVEIDADEAFAEMGSARAALVVAAALPLIAALLYAGTRYAYVRRGRRAQPRIGPYELKHRIGAGGVGEVYLAEHALLRRPTAIKLLRSRSTDSRDTAAATAYFEREVRAASSLTHPNTVEVYDYGMSRDGRFYYAMEFLPGFDLDALTAITGPLPAGRALHLLVQICDSLAEAHERGLVHRDVKPANVMVCERGGRLDFVKVLDFGLVADATDEGGRDPFARAGTLRYMPPERVRGNHAVDPRADVYGVGAIGYQLLHGTPLFAKVGDGLVDAVIAGRVEWSAEVVENSPALAAVLDLALARVPDDRPRNARELGQLLAPLRERHPWSDEDARHCWSHVQDMGVGPQLRHAV